jgi:hypothetical protein
MEPMGPVFALPERWKGRSHGHDVRTNGRDVAKYCASSVENRHLRVLPDTERVRPFDSRDGVDSKG